MSKISNKEFISNILKFSVPSIVTSLVAIAALPVISRIYPADQYGYISNFYSIGNLLMSVVLIGLDAAYIRFFNEPPEGSSRKDLFNFTLHVGSVTAILLTALVSFFSYEIVSDYLFNDNGRVPIVLLGSYVLSLVMYRMLSINLRFSENAKAYGIQQVCFIFANRLLFIIIAVHSTEYIYAAIVMVALTWLIVVVSSIKQKQYFSVSHISKAAKKQVLKFALPMLPNTVITFLNNSAAKLILGGFGLRHDVGVLAIATSAANVFSIIPAAFGTYWGPFMYKYYKTEQEKIRMIHDLVMLLSIIIVLIIVLFQDIIYYYLGESYRASQEYFMMIMLTPITTFIGETTTYGLAIKKKTNYILYITLLSCTINVLLCIGLIPYLGAMGAAIGVGVTAIISFSLRSYLGQKYYRSIDNVRRTRGSCVLLFLICMGNVVLCEKIGLRIICIVVAVAYMIIWYNKIIIIVYKKIVKGKKV